MHARLSGFARFAALATLLAGIGPLRPAAAQGRLKSYQTRYYTLYTDLTGDAVREAQMRIDTMAEAYYARTKGFSGGSIRSKLPFYLFRNLDDYYAAGGIKGSAGVFDGKKLMAYAGERVSPATWHVVQHEGFHQFVHAVIGGDIPIWVNEGLAEYFGESVYTGSNYLAGAVPPGRVKRIQKWIKDGNAISIRDMMTKSHELWNVQMSLVNYDQAWSMVHFLAHADGGRYQGAFNGFLRAASAGRPWTEAWEANFGRGVKEFEQQWSKYWLSYPEEGTRDLYAQAVTEILTNFYARAASQKQFFEDAESFFASAKAGKLQCNPADWLPPDLLNDALGAAEALGDWSVKHRSGSYALVCQTSSGTTLTGTYQLANGRVRERGINVQITKSRRP